MKNLKLLHTLFLLLITHFVVSQTFVLPDANLRNKLQADYPSVMQGNELLLSAAANLTGTLNLRNANISNADGIQYFTSITTLDLAGNKLTTIPNISNTTGLANFYATNNMLTSLPDMSALTQLTDFQVMNNELTALPNISGATGLKSLYCSNNNLTSLPSLSNFPNITRLVIGENPFAQPIDFSSSVNLEELHIHKINADTIIGLDKLVKLKILFAWDNNITDVSGLNNITTLTNCVIFDNPIDELPNLSNKPNLVNLDVNHCSLTFEDIQPVLQDPPASFIYSSPNAIPFKDQFVRETFTFSLSYPIENPLSNNVYVWIKDGVKLDSSFSPTYNLTPALFTDSGNYVLKIYNQDIPSITLSTDTFQLIVGPCVEFNLPFVNTIDQDCAKGYTIDLSNAKVAGGTSPFSYHVSNKNVYDKTFDDNILESVPAGKYNVTIIDVNGCTSSDNIVLNKIDGCAPVLTPDGDGVADTYFIENTGVAQIYDLKRHLLNTLEAPTVWDGTDKNGALLDAGYYILIQEGQPTVFITILR